jgi:hypothetical protein
VVVGRKVEDILGNKKNFEKKGPRKEITILNEQKKKGRGENFSFFAIVTIAGESGGEKKNGKSRATQA